MKLGSSHCVFSLPLCQYEHYKRCFVLRIVFDEAYRLCLLYFYITAPYCSFISCLSCLCSPFTLCSTTMAFVSHVFHAINGLLTYHAMNISATTSTDTKKA